MDGDRSQAIAAAVAEAVRLGPSHIGSIGAHVVQSVPDAQWAELDAALERLAVAGIVRYSRNEGWVMK